ncbi:MAG TPA: hypothetical protein VFW05_01750 [Verrucomicrobiae bacterium]|nr:hypothetical protein [Verrucomicrobiae bacterium]
MMGIATACATLLGHFKSWNDLEQQSSDIIVAVCTSIITTTNSVKRVVVSEGAVHSRIQVISVLKGTNTPGFFYLDSFRKLNPGDRFLLFANHRNGDYSRYIAWENYRFVPICESFQTDSLRNLSVDAQIRAVLSNRLTALEETMKTEQEEKARILTAFDSPPQ